MIINDHQAPFPLVIHNDGQERNNFVPLDVQINPGPRWSRNRKLLVKENWHFESDYSNRVPPVQGFHKN